MIENKRLAFPHTHLGIHKGQLSYEDTDYEDGMTLRDYFAAAALQGFCANSMAENITTDILAVMAYSAADDMLKRRER